MAYDFSKVPAGFQDLIPNNQQQQNTGVQQQDVDTQQQNTEIQQQNVGTQQQNTGVEQPSFPFTAPKKQDDQPDDFYLTVFGGARVQEENFAETVRYAEKDAQADYDRLKGSNIFRKYFATRPEVLAQGKKIAEELKLPIGKVIQSPQDFDAAVKLYKHYKKLKDIFPTGDKDFTLKELYKDYPELLKLNSDTDGAIALHNIQNVNAIKSVTDAAIQGYGSNQLTSERNDIGKKEYQGTGRLTEADYKRLEEIQKTQLQMLRYAPDFLEDPMKAIAYGTAEQGAMMVKQFARGQIYAIPLAGLVGAFGTAMSGPVAGGVAMKTAYAMATKYSYGLEMFKDTVGGYYLDYKGYKDKNGKQLLTDDEARLAATLAAAGEAYLEIMNWDTVVGMLKKGPATGEAEGILKNIVANAADKASFKAQLAYYMKNRFGEAAKAAGSEILEEGYQSVYTDLVHNAFALYKPKGDLKTIGATEMAANAWENMWGAVPSVIGMTGSGHIAGSSKYVHKIADWLTTKHEDVLTAQKTAGGINMLEQLVEDIKNSNLAQESRDVYDQLVTNSLEGTQYENVVVDTELLLNNPDGESVFYQLATAAGKTKEQADELKGSPLKVKVADYLKVVEDEKVREKLRTLISFDERDNCFKRIQENAKELRKEFDRHVDEQYRKISDRIENWVSANIEGDQEQAIMTQVLFEFMDPKEGVKAIRQQYQEEVDAFINPIVEKMKSGMGQGVTLFATDDNGNIIPNEQGTDVHIGGHTRVSNNDAWYSNYCKKNKKTPSESEMKQIARDALLGYNPYGVETGLEGADQADLAEFEDKMRSMFDAYDSVTESLDKLDKVVENLDTSELKAMDGLSVDGIKAFNYVKDFLLGKNGDVRKSAAASAIIVAHHAEIQASYMRQMGVKVIDEKTKQPRDYTALDYVKTRLGWGDGNIGAGGLNQQQAVHIGTELTIQRPIEEVKAAYEELQKLPALEGLFDELDSVDDIVDKRKVARKKFDEIYKNDHGVPVFVDTKYGDKVKVVTATFKEIKRHSANADVLKTIPYIKDLVSTATFLYATKPDPTRTKKMGAFVTEYRTLGNAFKVGSNEYYVKMVLRVEDSGVIVLHDLDLSKKTKVESESSRSDDYESPLELKDSTFVVNSIPWWLEEVKSKLLLNNDNILNQRAWHGTGAVFDNWDLGYAGSGEGGAAHGWGLYFAQDRKTAQGYRDMLTGGIDYTYKGKPITKLREQIERKGDYAKLEVLDDFLIDEDINEIAKSSDYDPKAKKWFLEKVAPYISGKGSLFEVEVPENDEMLDEGKSFTEHSKAVQDNVKKLVADLSPEQKELFKAPYLESIKKEAASKEIVLLEKAQKDYLRMAAWLNKLDEPPKKGLLYKAYLSVLEDFKNDGYDIDALKTSEEARAKAEADYKAKAAEVQSKIDADEQRREADFQAKKEAAEKNDIETVLNTMAGVDIYNGLWSVYGNQKDASLALNKAGVKGIAYDGGRDGRCFVVFSEDAVGTIERYNQAAGQNAETADKFQLARAQELYNRTGDMEAVLDATGWYLGMDGKWRFEIPDNLDRIDVNALPKKGERVTLGQVYDNPALYKAYPWLAKVDLYGKELEGNVYGQTDGFSITINVNREFPPWLNEKGKAHEIGKVLVHEIQHMIQEKEGFARGGNYRQVQQQISMEMDKTIQAMKDIHKEAWSVYIYHENITKALNKFDLDAMEQAEKDFEWITEQYKLTEEDKKRIITLGDAYRRLQKQYVDKDNSFNKYYNLHGEQEARLASDKAELATTISRMKSDLKVTPQELFDKWTEGKSEEVKAQGQKLMEFFRRIEAGEQFTAEDMVEFNSLIEDEDVFELKGAINNRNNTADIYQDLIEKYFQNVLNGINKNTAIIVFGGDVVAGSSINPQAARIQGATEINARGQHIVHIMETADQSTFMHEMAHVFYNDLRDLAMVENAPEQVKRDWQNLQRWTVWREGQVEEYKGTASYDDFKALDAAIREAQAYGKGTYQGQEFSLQSLMNRWAQERFARGFEEYLHSGKAPTKTLRSAFAKFKQWLTKIYKAVTGAGAKPTESVRKIMDRMIATQDEINNAMEESQLDALEKKGLFKYLNGSSQEMWEKNMADLQDDVSAKVMKIAMQDMTKEAQAERAEKIRAEREAAYERISQEPIFVVERYLRQNPNLSVADAVETLTGMTVEQYAEELKARGGSLKGAVDQYMQTYEKQLKEPTRQEIKAAAEAAIATSKYAKMAMVFEIQALEQYVLDEESLVRKLQGISKEEKAGREANEKAERLVNYVQRKQGKEHRIYRDALEGYIQQINEYAKKKMSGLSITEAANPAMWEKMAEDNLDDSINSFAKVEYGLATKQRRQAYYYHTMAEMAEKNRKEVDSKVKTLKGHARTMVKEKNMPANDRYLYNHLMYCFGLANKDAVKPPEYPANGLEILTNYGENLELSYVDQDGNVDLPDWLLSAISAESGSGVHMGGYQSLRMDQLQLLYNVLQNIYKCGRDAKALKTTRDENGNVLTVDQVVGEIVGEAMSEIPALEVRDPTGMMGEEWWEAAKRKANEAHVNLLKPETILRQLGDKAVKYIYNPIKVAADNELIETEKLAGRIRDITDAYNAQLEEMYRNQGAENPKAMADKDMKDMRSKRLYRIGSSTLTKEELICVALNWGTDLNRRRVLDGFNVSHSQVEKLLENMNSADWQMVINIWSLFDEYWPRLVEVEARCSGAVLEKQQALPFSIMDKSGFAYNLPGGYYPIKYDRHKSQNVGKQESDEAARMQLSGATRLGMGLGNTKERMEQVRYKLRLDFGVLHESLGDTIHNICMREAVRDAYRVIRDPNFNKFIIDTYGNATANMLENWALDCWKKEPRQKDSWEQVQQWVRQKQTMATLGFRTSTALLNICNLPYVIDYLGAGRTMAALKEFYARPSAQYDFIMEKSVFLRERAETMDRDMGAILKQNREKFGENIYDAITSKAFWFITKTDLMLACPLWISEYQRVYQESMDQKKTPEQAERDALLAGDAAVRRVFGSGQIQDQAGVQKGSEFTKILTMYYSFFSVVHNALMMKVFESRQAWRKSAKDIVDNNGNVIGSERDYKAAAKALVPIAEGAIFWMIIPAAMEACIRAGIGGDDKDLKAKKLAEKTLTTIAGTAVGGIPLLRDFVPAALEAAFGSRYFGVSSTPLGDFADQIYRVVQTVKSKKKTKLDVLRESLRATTPLHGLPTTMTDAMVSTMQFIDHGKLKMDDIRHYVWAVVFDKNYDKKK